MGDDKSNPKYHDVPVDVIRPRPNQGCKYSYTMDFVICVLLRKIT